MTEQSNSLQSLLDFIVTLQNAHIYFTLECHRGEAIMVRIDIPGERWEVEFFADGEIEIERFRSTGEMVSGDEARPLLAELIQKHAS